MAFDTPAKRAAAIGFGLLVTAVLPVAHGAIAIEDAGQALAAYRYDMPSAVAIVHPLLELPTAAGRVVRLGVSAGRVLALETSAGRIVDLDTEALEEA